MSFQNDRDDDLSLPAPVLPPGAPHSVSESEWHVVGGMVRFGAAAITDARKFLVSSSEIGTADLATAFRCLCSLTDRGLKRITPAELRAALADEFAREGHPYHEAPETEANRLTMELYAAGQQSPTGANVGWHAQRVSAAALMTRTRSEILTLSTLSKEWKGTPSELVAEVQRRTMALTDAALRASGAGNARTGGARLCEAMPEFRQKFRERYENPDRMSGLETPFPLLNKYIRGMRPGHLIVIAAESGRGKSTVAVNIVAHSARPSRGGAAWQVFSLEMERDEIIERMVFAESGVDSQRYFDQALTPMDWQRLEDAMDRLAASPVSVHADSSFSVGDIAAICREARHRGECDGIVVDYTQLITPEGQRRGGENREREVAEIIRSLKVLAGEISVPLIALSQLNDDGKVRESRAIKNDANVLLILRREEDPADAEKAALARPADAQGNPSPVTISYSLVVDKCRHGREGTVPVLFLASQNRFFEEDFNDAPRA